MKAMCFISAILCIASLILLLVTDDVVWACLAIMSQINCFYLLEKTDE